MDLKRLLCKLGFHDWSKPRVSYISPDTYKILERSTTPHQNFVECTCGDMNQELDKILDVIPGAFTFVYIDPFGLGNPVILYETVERVLKREFTEFFIHFSWEGLRND